jgi:signal transduction histidine kinase
MQREFINVAAHELRTPVQPILGIAEIMEEDQMLGRHAKTVDINDNTPLPVL